MEAALLLNVIVDGKLIQDGEHMLLFRRVTLTVALG